MGSYWKERSNEYVSVKHSSLTKSLHPSIIAEIEDDVENVLDYGCGDGRLSEKILNKYCIAIHDISEDMLRSALLRLTKECVTGVYKSKNDIPTEEFECVVCSMVLVCIDNHDEMANVATTIFNSLKEKGTALIGVTHPCFRDQRYSDFFTDFSFKLNNYFDEGASFEVQVFDENNKTLFVDYHWSITYITALYHEVGFVLDKIIEVGDDKSSADYNGNVPPFLIYKFRKYAN